MAQTCDVLVVGGGVIGLTTAYELARAGARVHVVDQGGLGQESSWAGAGILPPGNPARARSPFDQLRAHSAAMFPELSADLRQRTGIDNGYLRCGGIELFPGGTGLSGGTGLTADEWRGEGVASEWLDEAAARKLEPALAAGLGRALYLPDMAQLRNPRHLKALVAGCQALGVKLSPGCPVCRVVHRGSCVETLETAVGALHAERFLVAAGAWSDVLLEQVGCKLGVCPVRGQIALLHAPPVLQRILMYGANYLVPRPDGRVLIGSTEEDAGFDKRTTAEAIAGLISLACRLAPALARAEVERAWAGLRPGSPDGLPFLGPVPGLDNLYVAAGHFRAGIQLSPATALLMKQLLLDQPLLIPRTPFRLDRAGACRMS